MVLVWWYCFLWLCGSACSFVCLFVVCLFVVCVCLLCVFASCDRSGIVHRVLCRVALPYYYLELTFLCIGMCSPPWRLDLIINY